MGEHSRLTVTYRGIFGVPEFRAVFAAQSISVVGDQFARVALAVLVFDRTHSAALTALTYGLTFLPDLVGGPLLSGLADRFPRRTVMVVSDLLRAALVAAMAIPGMHLFVVCVLLVIVQLLGPPANAARAALLPNILPADSYPAGQAALQAVAQAAQVIGFAGGGALVSLIGTGGVLLADSVTFALSAVLVWWTVRPRASAAADRGSWWHDVISGAQLVWRTRYLRSLVAFACVSGFFIVGEALAAPYAAELGGGATTVGLLFAAYAVGAVVASLIVARLDEAVRLRLLPMLVIASCLPLVACVTRPGLAVVLVLFGLSGAGSSYNVVASTTFVQSVPDDRRGQAWGLAVTALKVSQGLGVAIAGVAAEVVAVHQVVAGAGVLGVVAALGAVAMWRSAASSGAELRWVRPDVSG